MARTSGRTADRARRKRRQARREAVRSTAQLLSVLVGGAGSGALAILAAFPDTIEPIPPAVCLVSAGLAALATVVVARRLRPAQTSGRSRR